MAEEVEQREPRKDHGGGHGEQHAHDAADVKPVSRGRVITVAVVMLLVAVVLVVVGIFTRVRANHQVADDTNSLAEPTVLVAKPTRGQPAQEVILPGNIQAFTDSPIYARTNGYLKKWYFDIGAHVRKGQLLAEIESPEIDQQLAQARADLATAEANAGNAQTNAKRYSDLLKSDAVSQQDVDTFNTQAAATSTVVKSSQANVVRAQELVGFEKIVAPFDGVITARNVDTGQLISSGSGAELFHLASLNTLRVYVNVPQVYARAAVPGVVADLTFSETPGKKVQARLVRTSEQIDPVSRTLLAELEVDNRRGELMPGAYAQVHFKLKEGASTFVVPVSALMYRSEGLRIGTVVEGNKARLIAVTLGEDDGQTVQVVSGLDANSQVIEDPPDSLVDGELVKVSPQPPDASGSAGAGGAGQKPGGSK
jgi:RND family efflux transporter MFP subunit